MKKMNVKKVLVICAIIFGIINVIACASGSKPDSSEAEKISTSGEKTNNTEKPADKLFKINEEVKLDNAVLVVTGIEKSKGNQYERKAGTEFIIVSLKIKNAGTKDRISYNPYDFKIENSKGTLTSEGYMSDLDTLNSGELAPSGEVSGKLVFEAPENDPKLTLEYQPSFWNDSVIRVALNY